MKLRNKKQSGFTLLELLVVVAILAIIAGAVISAISGQEELAGSKVAVHTMGALENAVRQQVVLNGGLPDDMDSLICADITTPTNTSTIATPEIMGAQDGNSGGLAPGLFGKVINVTLPGTPTNCEDDAEGACMLTLAGINSLRYAEVQACDEDATTASVNGFTVGGEEYNEILANILFWDANDEGAAGASVPIDDTNPVPVAIMTEPADIGLDPDDVVGVFGVGNFSEMSESDNAKIISRGPVDGNVDGDGQYYSHFSVAVKLGEGGSGSGLISGLSSGDALAGASVEWEADEVEIVAILDSDGDNFDDEVAEASGLEDE